MSNIENIIATAIADYYPEENNNLLFRVRFCHNNNIKTIALPPMVALQFKNLCESLFDTEMEIVIMNN